MGAGAPSFDIVRFPEIMVGKAARSLGMGDGTTQRLWMSFLFGLAASSIAYLALSLGLGPLGAGFAGLLGVFNLYFLQVFPSPVVLTALATAGFAGGVIVRAAKGQQRAAPGKAALSTLGLSYAFINPPLVLVVLAWLVAMVLVGWWIGGAGAGHRLVRFGAAAIPLALIVNAWWVVPAYLTLRDSGASATSSTFSATTDVRAWAWTHANASLSNVVALGGGWGWTNPSYFPYAKRLDSYPFLAFRYVLPTVALLAPVAANHALRRVSFGLFGVALATVWIAKGLHSPLSGTNLFLYDNIPGFWLLREPTSKVLLATVMCYAVLGGVTLQSTFKSVRWPQVAIVAGLVTVMLAAIYPLFTGGVIPGRRPLLPAAHVRIPAYWESLARLLNGATAHGKVLVLPLNDYYQVPTTWGYYGADLTASLLIKRPVLSNLPSGYFAPPQTVTDLLRDIENSLIAGNVTRVAQAARLVGARYLVVRRDINTSFPGRHFANAETLRNSLNEAPEIRLVHTFGQLDLYEIINSGEVFAATNTVQYARSHDELFHYADGDGKQPNSAEYKNLVVTAESSARLALTPLARGSTAPTVSYVRTSPSQFRADIRDTVIRPKLLWITETYAPGWRLVVDGGASKIRHVRINGYANGWFVEGRAGFRARIVYGPETLAARARLVSVVSVTLLLGAHMVIALKRRKHTSRSV